MQGSPPPAAGPNRPLRRSVPFYGRSSAGHRAVVRATGWRSRGQSPMRWNGTVKSIDHCRLRRACPPLDAKHTEALTLAISTRACELVIRVQLGDPPEPNARPENRSGSRTGHCAALAGDTICAASRASHDSHQRPREIRRRPLGDLQLISRCATLLRRREVYICSGPICLSPAGFNLPALAALARLRSVFSTKPNSSAVWPMRPTASARLAACPLNSGGYACLRMRFSSPFLSLPRSSDSSVGRRNLWGGSPRLANEDLVSSVLGTRMPSAREGPLESRPTRHHPSRRTSWRSRQSGGHATNPLRSALTWRAASDPFFSMARLTLRKATLPKFSDARRRDIPSVLARRLLGA